MFESVEFVNFKVLRNTRLPLGPFTLIVGPNGSGKSTALQALEAARRRDTNRYNFRTLASAGLAVNGGAVALTVNCGPSLAGLRVQWQWTASGNLNLDFTTSRGNVAPSPKQTAFTERWDRTRIYHWDASRLASPVELRPSMELGSDGSSLAGVLDRLRDEAPERFEALNEELGRLLPEFDRILFETPNSGQRAFLLRTRHGQHRIPAADLSQGTLLALAMLTLAYLPHPPPLIGLEEPDRGIHPRLLRPVRDALYRLSYPADFGETRPPVQVVATTQSPYFLDLFKDHPEEIVIAQKEGLEARFERLVDRPDIDEILADAPLGEVWFSGVLGGVPGAP